MGGHKSGGIAWREWSDEAFADARDQGKPVLLDIGAVWCHWCHVMDDGIPGDPVHTGTYSDPAVQQRIAADFIPVKVDNDRRPDINARYNMGGWPTTAFLTGDGDTLYGETYVTPARMIGLLDHIADIYKNQRDQVEEQTRQMRERRASEQAARPTEAPLDPRTSTIVAESIVRNFDPQYGGFGTQPKFPHPDALIFALERYSETGDPRLKAFAETTMRGMDSGGMYDRFAGGFFRYSTTRDWSIPHYEKMLEDNARLTEAYALASVALADDRYMDTVRSAHGWLLSTMYDPANPSLAGSQDADAEEAYYGEPLDARAGLPTPFIDRTVYVNWNALAVSSFAKRYQLTEEAEILDAAAGIYDFLRNNLADASDAGEVVFRHYWADGRAQGSRGMLIDQTAMLGAAIDLFETTGRRSYLDDAVKIAAYILNRLKDPADAAFRDLPPDTSGIGELSAPRKDLKENADASLQLLRLGRHLEQPQYHGAASASLRAFTDEFRNVGYFGAAYARAVEAATAEPLHIVIAGDLRSDDTKTLLKTAWKVVKPGKTVELIDVDPSRGEDERGYTPGPGGAPRAYVCIGAQCLAPAGDPEMLRARLFEALAGTD